MKVIARYIGQQPLLDGRSIRCYNVEGQHRLDGSTVSVRTLVEEGIDAGLSPRDLAQELILIDDFMKGR